MSAQTQPEALRLALMHELLSQEPSMGHEIDIRRQFCRDAAAELRRQHACIAELEAQLVAEAECTAAEKLRADQMSQQHDTQAALNRAARELLAAQRAPLTGAQMASVCLSYRHDFGLLDKADRVALIAEGRRWERAFDKQRANGITREAQ